MRASVRSTRGYLAGFGTSGSMLAGAAALFLLVSAVVAFRGWPQIAAGPATSAVAAADSPATPSRVARRLAVVLNRRAAVGAVSAVRGVAGRRTHTRGAGVRGGIRGPIAPPGQTHSTGTAPPTGAAGSSGAPSAVSSIGSKVGSQGSNLGSQVGSATNSLAGALSGVSPQAGNAVQNAGSTGGNVVPSTATTAGNTLTQAGNTVTQAGSTVTQAGNTLTQPGGALTGGH